MRETRLSGPVEGVVINHDSYSDYLCRLGTNNHWEHQVRAHLNTVGSPMDYLQHQARVQA
jgi:hypothetical protein